MSEHVDRERLIALRLGGLEGAESRELLNHVASCLVCQRAARETLAVEADGREMVRSLAEDRPARRRVRAIRWLAAAALIAALLIALPFLLRRRADAPAVVRTPIAPPTRTTTTTAPPPAAAAARLPQWEAVVRDAITAGGLQVPATLARVQPAADRFRAAGEVPPIPDLRPYAEVIESDTPELRWPEEEGATYTVIVGDRGEIVTQSAPLQRNRWRCDVTLRRGRTYTWQVEVRRGETGRMLPFPPAPPARFHVLGAEAKAQLDAARASAPDDHLLLGILSARAGLRERALEHLRAATEAQTPGADALLESVRRWPVWHR